MMPIAPYHIHPLVVHFPIALLIVAAFFEWIMPLVSKSPHERWVWMGVSLLWLGTAFCVLAIGTGLWAEATAPAIPSAWDTVGWHKKCGIAVGVFASALSVWRWFRRPPAIARPLVVYALLWLALIVALGLTGWLGGNLVFEFGVGVDTP